MLDIAVNGTTASDPGTLDLNDAGSIQFKTVCTTLQPFVFDSDKDPTFHGAEFPGSHVRAPKLSQAGMVPEDEHLPMTLRPVGVATVRDGQWSVFRYW